MSKTSISYQTYNKTQPTLELRSVFVSVLRKREGNGFYYSLNETVCLYNIRAWPYITQAYNWGR